jgi:hypothetical protein
LEVKKHLALNQNNFHVKYIKEYERYKISTL